MHIPKRKSLYLQAMGIMWRSEVYAKVCLLNFVAMPLFRATAAFCWPIGVNYYGLTVASPYVGMTQKQTLAS